ncbi:hypothetical protein [Paenibacillus urinalis]|uniref:hypothetical protein n=1 Tax=Paenibacillus urinalis TaxID=521520 RepID=UPI00195F997E
MATSPFNNQALAEALRKRQQNQSSGTTTSGTTTTKLPVATATTVAEKPTTTSTTSASSLGQGGTNYTTADLAARRAMQSNASRLRTDPSYAESETQRALRVIQERQAKGMDTSQQQKYLTTNLGYTGPTTGTTAAASTPVTNAQKGQSLMDQITQLAQRQSQQFSYDPNNDPAYQAALKRAQANIQTGNAAAQAEMNRRGILNSTITSDRMGEISSQEMGRVETDVLPSLMQQAYAQYLNQQQQDQQQLTNLAAAAEMYLSEDQRRIENEFATSDRTGYLAMPAEAQSAINSIISLKQQAETPGITAADRSRLSAQADGYRAQLLAMGIDPSAYASSISSANIQANPGIRTLAGQTLDLQNRQANLNAAVQYSDLTGRLMTPQSDWTGYMRQAANPNTPLTLAGQQQGFNQETYLQEFAYQKARDAIADQQWKAQFDENVRQFGLGHALSLLSEQNQQAYQQAQLALSEDDNLRQWASLDYDMSLPSSGSGSSGGLTANQVLDSVRSMYTEPVISTDENGIQTQTGSQLTKDPTKRQNMFLNVVDANLSDDETYQILAMLGFSKEEINKYQKQYAGK